MTALQLRNCEFAFRCDAQWDQLIETSQVKVRFCDTCNKEVRRCDTDDELLESIKLDLCIAIPDPLPLREVPKKQLHLGSVRLKKIPH
jgi:hypothetical protein